MQCKSCSEAIAPKFSHALKSNICPFCGNEIISLELQVALSELQEVLKSAETYRSEICEWLRANYDVMDMKSDEYKDLQEKAALVNKMPVKQAKTIDPKKVVLDTQGNQVSGEALQSAEVMGQFMQRAEVKVNQQDRYREIINQIKRGGSSTVSMGGGGGGHINASDADPEEVMAMQNALASPLPAINSGLMSNDFEDDGELPPVVEAMAAQASGNKGADYNAKDVAKLQALQSKAARTKRAMEMGGSVGLIKR